MFISPYRKAHIANDKNKDALIIKSMELFPPFSRIKKNPSSRSRRFFGEPAR
jgi:hypothetical protein